MRLARHLRRPRRDSTARARRLRSGALVAHLEAQRTARARDARAIPGPDRVAACAELLLGGTPFPTARPPMARPWRCSSPPNRRDHLPARDRAAARLGDRRRDRPVRDVRARLPGRGGRPRLGRGPRARAAPADLHALLRRSVDVAAARRRAAGRVVERTTTTAVQARVRRELPPASSPPIRRRSSSMAGDPSTRSRGRRRPVDARSPARLESASDLENARRLATGRGAFRDGDQWCFLPAFLAARAARFGGRACGTARLRLAGRLGPSRRLRDGGRSGGSGGAAAAAAPRRGRRRGRGRRGGRRPRSGGGRGLRCEST